VGDDSLSLKVVLQANDLASGMLKGFGATLVNLAGDAGPLLKVFGGISLAAIAVGVQAVQMAGQYDQSMRMVQALTGSSQAQMARYDTQVKALAIDAGVAPNALASGLYNVLSASYSGADAMRVLTLATQDSKIGMTSAAVATNGLTNILRTFNISAKDATRVNGEMLETVTLGKATFAQYASNITKAASSSKQFHVSMETMNAAWSTLTSTGISAGQATTDYTQLLSVMYGNIGTVTASLHKNGIAFDEARFNAMSFGDKVRYLNQVLETANQKHVHITGVTKQAAQAIQALASHTQNYNSNLKTLSDHQAMGQKTAQAWAITQGGFKQSLDRAGAAVQVLFIDIGQKLLPILTKIVSFVAPAVNWLINFARAASQNEVFMALLKGALIAFAGVALGILIPAFISWAIAAGAAAIATLAATWPLLLVILIITLVVAAIILLWTHWKQVTQWIGDRLGELGNWFHDQFAKIGGFFDWLGTQIHQKIQLVIAFFDGLRSGIGQKIQAVLQFFRDLPGKIGSFLASLPGKALQWGQDLITGFLNGIKDAAGKLWQGIQDIGSGIKKFLGFSKPEAGPLSTADQWMPDMMTLMTQGIIAGHPKLQAAVHQTATVMAAGMAPSGQRSGYAGVPYGRPPAGNSYSSSVAGGNTHNGDIIIHAAPGMNIQQLADEIERRQNRKYRSSGLMGNPARGMRDS
jgi:TP901 family phage tail tape measure protein